MHWRLKKIDIVRLTEDRLCKACKMGEIETEDHFLTKCKFYDNIKAKYNIDKNIDSISLVRNRTPDILSIYLFDAWSERERKQ